MTTDRPRTSARRRATLVAAGGALVVGLGLGAGQPQALAAAWRFAVFACVGPAVGSLVFFLIYQMTGGEWGRVLLRFLLAGTALLPWLWLLVLPLLVTSGAHAALAANPGWASPAAVAVRSVVYGAGWFLLAGGARRTAQRLGGGSGGALGPAGLIAVVFMTHLLAGDWLSALDPRWLSTAFPLVWLIGQAVAGLAVAVIAAVMAGADPARVLGSPGRRLGIDWGTLLFTAAMMWCYVAFAQFLIIWSGNLPVETSWFARRLQGPWRFVPALLLVLDFAMPLGVLLSRRAKQNRRMLLATAVVLLGAQTLHSAWIILPGDSTMPGMTPWLGLLLAAGLAGVVGVRYLALAERECSWLEVERVDPNAPGDAADLGDGRSRTTRWGQRMPPGEVS
jgi:hypothetical protein